MKRHAYRLLWFALLVSALALGGIFFAAPAHADDPASLEDYRSAIADARAQVEQAKQQSSPAREQALAQAAATLGAIHTLQLESGATVEIDNAALVAQLADADKLFDSLERLTALQAAMSAPVPPVNQDQLDRLNTILSRPPFAAASPNWLQGIVDRMLEYLDRLLSNTARGIFDVRDLLVLLGIAVAGAVFVFLVRNLRRNLVAEEVLPPPLVPGDARTSAEAFANAQRLIQARDYRGAVRQLYLATLYLLDQRERIKFDPSLTNREYLSLANGDAATLSALKPIIETFDRTWYGFEPISPQEFETYRERVEKVREL